jgi:hypothetical protein
MYRILFKYYYNISMNTHYTRVMQSVSVMCYPYEAANTIDDILKLCKAMLGSSSAGSAAMKDEGSQDAMADDREGLDEEIGDVVKAADEEDTKVLLVGHRRVAGLICPLTMITDSYRVQ